MSLAVVKPSRQFADNGPVPRMPGAGSDLRFLEAWPKRTEISERASLGYSDGLG
jgi:hypothetical protein